MTKADIIARIKEDHFINYNKSAKIIAIAPGRVNIIGEHTDYNNGLAMPAAINRYVFISLSFNSQNIINAYSDAFKSKISVSLDNISSSTTWHKYILGSVKEIFNHYKVSHGLDILIYSNLPIGKGISSSAALEVALINGILKLFNIKETDENIIKRCQNVDHKYIGIKSGILDQSASQLSKDGNVLKLDFNDQSFSYIKTNFSGYSWVLIDSTIKRELASSKYHERVNECQKALSIISKTSGKRNTFRNISINEMSCLIDSYPKLFNRIKHLVTENNRVEQMEIAIANNNPKQIGQILNKSHLSLRDLYEVSCIEINYLISISYKFKYWYGGRIMGGGFGGNTINLIKVGEENNYFNFIKEKYKEKFNLNAKIYNVKFSNGVETIINL